MFNYFFDKIRRLRYKIFGSITIDGLKLPFYKFTETTRLLLLNKNYETVERDFVKKYLPEGAYVVEFGASIGYISCHILQKKPIKLLSFEAVAEWAKVAHETVRLNFKDAPFELVEKAIAPKGQNSVTFYFNTWDNLGGLVHATESDSAGKTLPALSLGDVNRVYKVPTQAWLIMDIEGMEWEIIRNQKESLEPYKGIIVECHQVTSSDGDRKITPQDIVDEFLNAGFNLIDISSHETHIVAVFKQKDS